MTGEQEQAKRLAERAVETEAHLGLSPSFWPRALLAQFAWYLGRFDEAWVLSEVAWAIEKKAELHPYDRFWSILLHGWQLHERDPPTGRRFAAEAVDLARQLQVPTVLAWSLYLRGTLRRRSDPDAAMIDLREAITVAKLVGANYVEVGSELALVSAMALSAHPDPVETLSRFDQLLERQLDNGDLLRTATTLRQLALHLAEHGHPCPAAVLRAAEVGFPTQPIPAVADPERHESAIRSGDRLLDPATLDECRTEGRSMTIADAARFARNQIQSVRRSIEPLD
jgi:hypothetical protein